MSPKNPASQALSSEIPTETGSHQFLIQLQRLADLVEHLKISDTQVLTKSESPQLDILTNQLSEIAKNLPHPAIRVIVEKIHTLVQAHYKIGHTDNILPSLNALHSQIETLKQITQMHLETEQPLRPLESSSKTHHILLGLTDKQLLEEIISQVKYFNYTCTTCDSLEDMQRLVSNAKTNTYNACLLDTDYCTEHGPEQVLEISENVPTIFISFDESVESRLFAVKAGGLAYMIRPIEFTSLIEKVDSLTIQHTEGTPYRVLIIEDSKTQAKFIEQQLKNAAMITEVVTNPLEINKKLQEFQPELILMDLYMPKCTGFELTKMIRQQDSYTSIPIVYLSAEEDRDTQLYAITIGGDDFLTKPIEPDYLVAAIKARAERARTLRAEMIQDSLTGLLNHTRILEQLDLEIARAKRNDYALTFSMVDIDFFKSINDNHGHPVGDRVIKGLARLLKQRLRKTDSVGRYGGEEFAIILTQSDSDTVQPLLDDIRKGFAKLLHQGDNALVEFTATVSIGAAEYNAKNKTAGELIQAADRALYKAKSEGRNCIRFDEK